MHVTGFSMGGFVGGRENSELYSAALYMYTMLRLRGSGDMHVLQEDTQF